ncbi:dipeptidase [Sorangium sp. So ce1335]|uniref:dipeptidase n=1 Tax=Sorangium sp. So ce1335 TaxID=3133335 RepID=UPI003F5E233C
MKKKAWLYALGALVAGLGVFHFVLPPVVDDLANATNAPPPAAPDQRALALHQGLWVADLHADSLMWNRSLNERNERGHVDVPRLIEGGVALQAFTIVSQVPWDMNLESNSGTSDLTALLFVAERWPLRTWTSLLERALYQAERLHAAALDSGGKLRVIRTRGELTRYIEARARDPRQTAGFLGLEGAQVLEGKLENVQRLFDAGFRMMAPSHFFDTEVGGSAHGEQKHGLLPFGRQVIAEMERLGMLVDLAHASPQTIDDVLAVATKPVVFSHTGVLGTCDSPRNISDAALDRTAAAGGVVGIGFFESATCGADLASIVRAIRYTVDRIGVDHVALGSDFDGFVETPIDASQMASLTEALLGAGFSEDQIRAIMGLNVQRVLSQVLPP